MEKGGIDLLTLLFSVKVTPTQISNLIDKLRGPDAGSFMPKHIYDMNWKTENLHDYVTGLLPESNDAKKTIAKLEQSNINMSTYCMMILVYMYVLKAILVKWQ